MSAKGFSCLLLVAALVPFFLIREPVSAAGDPDLIGQVSMIDDVTIVDKLEVALEKDEKGTPNLITGNFLPGAVIERKMSIVNEGAKQDIAFSFKFFQGETAISSPSGIKIHINPPDLEGMEPFLLAQGESFSLPRGQTNVWIVFEIMPNARPALYQKVQVLLKRSVRSTLEEAADLFVAQDFGVAESIEIESRTQPTLSRDNVLSSTLVMRNLAQVEQQISLDFLFLLPDQEVWGWNTLNSWRRSFPRQIEITIGRGEDQTGPLRPVTIQAATEDAVGRTFIPIEIKFLPGPTLERLAVFILVRRWQ